jgi:hypothetical protein
MMSGSCRAPSATRGKGVVLFVDLGLHNTLEVVLDRVFDRDDFAVRRVYLAHKRIERRRFTRAGRAGGEDHAVGLGDLFFYPQYAGLLRAPAPPVGRQ